MMVCHRLFVHSYRHSKKRTGQTSKTFLMCVCVHKLENCLCLKISNYMSWGKVSSVSRGSFSNLCSTETIQIDSIQATVHYRGYPLITNK